jgi:hypothetical protein
MMGFFWVDGAACMLVCVLAWTQLKYLVRSSPALYSVCSVSGAGVSYATKQFPSWLR